MNELAIDQTFAQRDAADEEHDDQSKNGNSPVSHGGDYDVPTSEFPGGTMGTRRMSDSTIVRWLSAEADVRWAVKLSPHVLCAVIFTAVVVQRQQCTVILHWCAPKAQKR